MRICIITPSLAADGNLVTARRYAGILKALGHRVRLQRALDGETCDLMIALHARRSHRSILEFRQRFPASPLVVVLTGTDLYRDLGRSDKPVESIQFADRLVVLQQLAIDGLPERFRTKTRVIYQSAEPVFNARRPTSYFRLAVIGHLRREKDPLLAAYAVRRLPSSSRVKLFQAGRALDSRLEKAAGREARSNPRYRWLGELSHLKSRSLIAGSHLLGLTSRIEGSSNALSEALASSTPVVASAIPGLMGTLGPNYPGLFPVGDTAGLAELIRRAECDPGFYETLLSHCDTLRPLVSPARERQSWEQLIDELC